MPTDASGTPTALGIPKYDVNADRPSGLGFNVAMDTIDALLTSRANETLTQNNATALRLTGAAAGLTIGGDTNLYRSTAGVLQTDGKLQIGASDLILSRSGAGVLQIGDGTHHGALMVEPSALSAIGFASLVTNNGPNNYFQIKGDGKIEWGAGGGSTVDTNLYRVAGGWLQTDGLLRIGGSDAAVANSYLAITPPASTGNAIGLKASGDAQYRCVIRADGQISWSTGGAGFDTNLYRGGAGVLKTDHTMVSIGNGNVLGFEYNPSAAAGSALVSLVQGESFGRFGIDVAGTLNWGPGSAGNDTNLYRNAADRLKTDDLFDATTLALATKQKAGAPVDGDWAATPPNGTIVVDSTNNKIWARVGGVWKGVVIA